MVYVHRNDRQFVLVPDRKKKFEEIRCATTNGTSSGTSIRELDQPGIEHDREEDVACGYKREWEEDGPRASGDSPFQREEAG